MINWNGKRRWIALLLLIAGFVIMLTVPPVIPVIQLPGEVYPEGWSLFGLPMTNTMMGSIIVWILLILLAVYVSRKMPKSGDEVPPGGFYNIFEMLFEGLYGFILNIVGAKYMRYIFSFFMTIFLIVLVSNWLELIPGVDSLGFLEPHTHVDETTGEVVSEGGYETMTVLFGAQALNPKCPWVSPEEAAVLTLEAQEARAATGCKTGTGAPVAEAAHEDPDTAVAEETVADGAVAADESAHEGEAAATEEAEAATDEAGHEVAAATDASHEEGEAAHHPPAGDPSVPWVVLPFLRAPSTDLNMTVALALVAVIMTQVIGFRSLGVGYLTKFFNFKTLLTSPLGGIDVAVGLLELIGEFARILSFAFRLLGNIFAGSILLFVMSFLLPFLPWPFFILEFFVGALQAFVFGLLTAIFMNLATMGHGGEHHDEHEGAPAEAAAH